MEATYPTPQIQQQEQIMKDNFIFYDFTVPISNKILVTYDF